MTLRLDDSPSDALFGEFRSSGVVASLRSEDDSPSDETTFVFTPSLLYSFTPENSPSLLYSFTPENSPILLHSPSIRKFMFDILIKDILPIFVIMAYVLLWRWYNETKELAPIRREFFFICLATC